MTYKEAKELRDKTIIESNRLGKSSLTPAGKLELVMNLLNPVNEDDEPQEPLITPKQARELLGFKDEE